VAEVQRAPVYTWYDPFAPAHGDADPNLGVWTNLYFPTLELGSRPDFGIFDKQVTVSARWRYLQSVEDNGPGSGNEVGQLATFYLEWRPLPYFRAHYYFDYFFVGDYYSASAEDAWFSRIEIMFLFN
jgi:hypothetical protein